MPNISIECGELTIEQKNKLIARLSEVSAEIMNIPQSFFMVMIHELPESNIGIGGKSLDIIKKEYYQANNMQK